MPPETHPTHTNGNKATTPAATASAKKERKAAERKPRTDEKKLFDSLDNVLKKADPDMRVRVLKAINALYAAS